ncbi:hypothetical protein PAJ_2173 [Pantoea ananatis AJ13355]|uniref:Uncharacterized protein n=1 Tax=Pantoea ananatis (strain AJ13355) TaxID=932677 RepID=A0A0H3KYY8_PANAA|nr:hypothetical protein PAJ_2173 [Pantoea ananatis AJ13355]
MEERLELIAYARVKQNGFRPTFTRAQYVTVGETATGHQRLERFQIDPARQQVTHMHVNRRKTCPIKGGRHFHMRVNALLAQHGNAWTRARCNHRCRNVFVWLKGQANVQSGIGVILLCLMFLIGTGRVITQTLHLPGGFCPPGPQGGAAFAVNRAVA